MSQEVARPNGLMPGLAEEIYFSGNQVSYSTLKDFDKSPRHMKEGERETTAAQSFGKLIHTAILEPHLLSERYAVSDLARFAGKEYDKEVAMAMGREVVKRAQYDAALKMRDSAIRDGQLRELLLHSDTRFEVSGFFRHERTGLPCRFRIDILNLTLGIMGDLKKVTDARNDPFMRSVRDYKYHWQHAFYRAGMRALGYNNMRFIFFAIEDSAPHDYIAWELPHELVDRAESRIESLLDHYSECAVANNWPGYYHDQAQELSVPQYLLNDTWMEEPTNG